MLKNALRPPNVYLVVRRACAGDSRAAARAGMYAATRVRAAMMAMFSMARSKGHVEAQVARAEQDEQRGVCPEIEQGE